MNIYDIWFSRVDISNSIKLKLLEKFDVLEIFKMNEEELINLGLRESTAKIITQKEYKVNLEKYEKYMEKNKVEFINFRDKKYPWKLKHIPDLPAYIFVKGNVEILDDESVAIIGSRNCTAIGKKIAYNTGKELGDKNINVISGLAIGIDTFAHKGSLKSKFGKTVAVLANGLADKDIYPQENLSLAKEIIERGGALVSEHIVGTKSKKYYFPIRNRIVSGLADKILVVEANEKSGTLITVRSWFRTRKRYIFSTAVVQFWKLQKVLIY